MSEHKHEWVIDDDYRWFKCACGASPSTEDIVRSLNATECLSADDACIAADVVFADRYGTIPDAELEDWVKSLRDYADLREGKDETNPSNS